VREGADGEGELVGGAGVAEERVDEVSGADVVGELGEERVAEGVVADVLDDGAAVGVGVSFAELGGGDVGKAGLEEGDDVRFPGEVDELLVGFHGVGVGCGRGWEGQEENEGEEELAEAWVHGGLCVRCVEVGEVKRFYADGNERRAALVLGVRTLADGWSDPT